MRLNVYFVSLQFRGCKGKYYWFRDIQVYAHSRKEAVCEALSHEDIAEILKTKYVKLVNWQVE